MTNTRKIARIVPGIAALKALAHPDRLRILGSLRISGPSTATALAKRFGLNSGATSYHLRQLALHGFIGPAPDLGNKRDRWWRAAHESTLFDTATLKGDDFETGLAFTQAVLSGHAHMMQRAQEAYRKLPVAWRKASTNSDYTISLTPPQAAALTERISDLLMEAKAAGPAPDDPLPQGARPFTYLLYAFPYPEA